VREGEERGSEELRGEERRNGSKKKYEVSFSVEMLSIQSSHPRITFLV